MLQPERDLGAIQDGLAAWLRTRMPETRDLTISELTRPKAGFSNDTLLFELSYLGDGRRCVERLVARFAPAEFRVFPEYDLAAQAKVMQCLTPTDVPVPRVRWVEEDARILGQTFYIMDAIAGELPSEVPPYHSTGFCFETTPARRARIWWSGLETLARIHALDWSARGRSPQPILAHALAWLREHRYAPRQVALCWGDARLPNLIDRNDDV